MPQTAHSVQADFDRIALLPGDERWSHNTHYHRYLLRQLPPRIDAALDIGCGSGAFSRLLAKRAREVTGLDLSTQMVRIASERSRTYPNVRYVVADVMQWPMPPARYDCIASIATLHHLPLADVLRKAKAALMPGGTLLVLDLYRQATLLELLSSVLTVPVSLALRLLNGGLKVSPEAKAAWDEHGRTDSYLTMREVRAICAQVMPGAHVRRHLLWRYSIVWKKPSA
jgi:ubiquinone/menaquinone biosynthesis C-methylase UbiE